MKIPNYSPLAGLELANELKKHHIYITASVNEPSGNHHIEAAQCGLPILYLDSGGIPEYCEGYGVSFSNDFEDKLKTIIDNYDFYKEKLKNYPFNSEKMCHEFVQIFQDLVDKQDKIATRLSFASNVILFKNKLSKFTRKNKFSTLKSIIKDRLIK